MPHATCLTDLLLRPESPDGELGYCWRPTLSSDPEPVELHDCSTAEAFTNVYGCLMQQQMAGCWECPQNNPNGNPAAGTDCDSFLCNLDCPQCRTWSAVPCSPGFPGYDPGGIPMQPYSPPTCRSTSA